MRADVPEPRGERKAESRVLLGAWERVLVGLPLRWRVRCATRAAAHVGQRTGNRDETSAAVIRAIATDRKNNTPPRFREGD